MVAWICGCSQKPPLQFEQEILVVVSGSKVSVELDLGNAVSDGVVLREFEFKNNSGDILLSPQDTTGCPCFRFLLRPSRVEPGGRGSLQVTYEWPDTRTQVFSRQAAGAISKDGLILSVSAFGTLVPWVELGSADPVRIAFDEDNPEVVVHLKTHGNLRPILTASQGFPSWLEAKIEGPDGSERLLFAVDPDKSKVPEILPTEIHGLVVLQSNDNAYRSDIPLTMSFPSQIRIRPSVVMLDDYEEVVLSARRSVNINNLKVGTDMKNVRISDRRTKEDEIVIGVEFVGPGDEMGYLFISDHQSNLVSKVRIVPRR